MGGVNTSTREVLNKVLDILEQGLRDIIRARDTVIDTNKRDIADVSWIKVKDLQKSQSGLWLNNQQLLWGHTDTVTDWDLRFNSCENQVSRSVNQGEKSLTRLRNNELVIQ